MCYNNTNKNKKMRIFRSIKIKLTAPIYLALFIAITILCLVGVNRYSMLLNMDSEAAIKEQADKFELIKQKDIETMSAAIDMFAEDEEYKNIFISGDREALYKKGLPLYEKLEAKYSITHFYFHLTDGVNFLRLHDKEKYDDKIERFTFKEAKYTQKIGTGLELGKTAFALRVVKPYYKGEKLIGYIELGKEIGHFLQILKGESEDNFMIIADKKYLDETLWASVRESANSRNNWNDDENYLIINSTFDGQEDIEKSAKDCSSTENIESIRLGDGPMLLGDYNVNGETIQCGGFNMKDAGGNDVGAVFVLRDITEYKLAILKEWIVLIGGAIVVLFILSLGIFSYISKVIINPLKKIEKGTEEIAKGDLDKRIEVFYDDEIGSLAKNINVMAANLKKEIKSVEQQIEEKTKQIDKINSYMVETKLKPKNEN